MNFNWKMVPRFTYGEISKKISYAYGYVNYYVNVLNQFHMSNMLNQSLISEEFQYEDNFVLKKSGK